jgi:chaperone required for assembly of F1-ATPase
VALDNKPIKTLYKDALYFPSRALAVAVAQEWEHQQETIDMRTMYLNTMMSKAVKVRLDDSLSKYMRKEILKVIRNDQICFVEAESLNNYKTRLRDHQLKYTNELI